MKTIGIIGGCSFESTSVYYQRINEQVRISAGGLTSAPLLVDSLNFAEVAPLLEKRNWQALGERLSSSARRLEAAGASAIALSSNTMHRVAPFIAAHSQIPFLHIGDAIGETVSAADVKQIGLLGTSLTMEEQFYKDFLERGYEIKSIVPELPSRQKLNQIIFTELCAGKIIDTSRTFIKECIDDLEARGAHGIVLGCTELIMLAEGLIAHIPLYDSTALHIKRIVRYLMEGK